MYVCEALIKVITGTAYFYISAYNYESANARVQIEIESDVQIILDPLIIPLTCGQNAQVIHVMTAFPTLTWF